MSYARINNYGSRVLSEVPSFAFGLFIISDLFIARSFIGWHARSTVIVIAAVLGKKDTQMGRALGL